MASADDGERGRFTLRRVVDAPRALVWQLWTDPAELTHWFHPRGSSTPRDSITIDLRVGGSYRYTMIADGSGESTLSGGVYLEVREPERLVLTWGHPEDRADEAAVVTVTLEDRGAQTLLTVHVRNLAGPGQQGARDGWDEALDLLVEHLA